MLSFNLKFKISLKMEPGEFISPIFLTEKDDGGNHLILNLKKLNESAQYKKFKMDPQLYNS